MARESGAGLAVALGLGAVALAAAGAAGRAANGGGNGGGNGATGNGGSLPGGPGGPQVLPAGLDAIRAVAADVLTVGGVASNDWITFLAAVAHHESGWNPAVYNGYPRPKADVPSGVKQVNSVDGPGAVSSYNRNAERFAECSWPKSRYTFGSGGWYGFLPAVGLHAFRNSQYQCLDPWSVFLPYPSTIMAVDFARRNQRFEKFKREPTWRNLNRSWKAIGNMGSPQAGTDKRFNCALRAMGISESWGDQNVASLGPWNSQQASINVLGEWLGQQGIA